MSTLPSGATTDRIACGSTTSRKDWLNVRPIARAASACPAGTVLTPERIAASSTPNTREMPVDAPVSLRIHTNAAMVAARLFGSVNTSKAQHPFNAGGGALRRAAPGQPNRRASGAVGQLRGVQGRRRRAALTERGVPGRLVPAIRGSRLQDLVDLVAAGLVFLLQTDAVRLGAERLAHHLELAGELRLRRVPGEDDVVGGDRVDRALGQRLHALGVRVEQLQGRLRMLGLDPLGRRGARHRADLLAVEGVRTGDGGVVHLHQQVLARHVVRPGEVDLLLAVVVDGVGGDHQVDRALLDERLAVGRRGGLPLDLVLGQAEILGDDLRDLDVEALVLAAGLQPEAGLVGLDPDDQLAFLLGLAHHAGFRRAAATGVVALAAARGGGAERQRQTGQQRQSLVASHAHSSLSASVPWTGSPWRARCAGWRRTRPAPPAPPAGRRP